MLVSAKFLSDSGASGLGACRLRVAIVLLAFDSLYNRLVDDGRQLETIGTGGLTQAEPHMRLLMVRIHAQLLFQDLTDRVDDVGAGGGTVLDLGPGGCLLECFCHLISGLVGLQWV